MAKPNESILENLRNIQSLRGFLKSEMSVDDSGEQVIATIRAWNEAPVSTDGGNVVFVDVGLRIVGEHPQGPHRRSPNWASQIKKAETSTQAELRKAYQEGRWIGGSDTSPPGLSGGQSHGEVLFPGESVAWEIRIEKVDLPYLDIRVEGSVSRRHLLQISQPMAVLKAWTQPLLAETFGRLDAIDFVSPLFSLTAATPAFGPETTIAAIQGFRDTVGKAENDVKTVLLALSEVKRPNRRVGDCMEDMRQYLKSFFKLFSAAQAALSGSDTAKMKAAADEMSAHAARAQDLKRRLAELKSHFGIDS